MTVDEINVAFKYRLPIIFSKNESNEFGFEKSKEYRIKTIEKFYQSKEKKAVVDYAIVIETNKKAEYYVSADDFALKPEWRKTAQELMKQEKSAQLKTILKQLKNEHKTKTELIKYIRKVIDDA